MLEEVAELRAQIAEMKDQNESINLSELREYLIGLEKSTKVEVTGLGYGGCGVGGIRQAPLNLFAKDLFKHTSSTNDTITSLQSPVLQQKREFKIINKETNKYLYSDSDNALTLNPSTYSHMPPGHSIWTLEPV